MSGPELAGEVQRRRPGVKVLYMSGYSEEVMARHGRPRDGVHLLQKPFRKGDLARMVRAMLDGVEA